MKLDMSATVMVFVSLVLPSYIIAGQLSEEGGVEAFLDAPQMEIQQIFESERFPNIVVLSLIHI